MLDCGTEDQGFTGTTGAGSSLDCGAVNVGLVPVNCGLTSVGSLLDCGFAGHRNAVTWEWPTPGLGRGGRSVALNEGTCSATLRGGGAGAQRLAMKLWDARELPGLHEGAGCSPVVALGRT